MTILIAINTIGHFVKPDSSIAGGVIQIVAAAICATLFWLTMRSWKKQSPPEPTPPVLSAIA
jgi:hypothetical protein